MKCYTYLSTKRIYRIDRNEGLTSKINTSVTIEKSTRLLSLSKANQYEIKESTNTIKVNLHYVLYVHLLQSTTKVIRGIPFRCHT